jgi:hypothetical protein
LLPAGSGRGRPTGARVKAAQLRVGRACQASGCDAIFLATLAQTRVANA